MYNKKGSITAAKLASEKVIAGDFSAFVMSSHTLKATHLKHGYFIISAAFDKEAKVHMPRPQHIRPPASSLYKTLTCTWEKDRSERELKQKVSCIAFGLAVQSTYYKKSQCQMLRWYNRNSKHVGFIKKDALIWKFQKIMLLTIEYRR